LSFWPLPGSLMVSPKLLVSALGFRLCDSHRRPETGRSRNTIRHGPPAPKPQDLMNTKKMPSRTPTVRNDYRCSMERNQSGKYCVRIQVFYPRHAWTLGVFFLASSFDRAMKKLEESLDFLQRHEEKLWFWGVDRAEDMGFSAEFLREAGMKLDHRTEFPRRATNLSLAPEREVPAFVLGPVRRGLAESVEAVRTVAAGD
jgi:hypothetical protein